MIYELPLRAFIHIMSITSYELQCHITSCLLKTIIPKTVRNTISRWGCDIVTFITNN